MVKIPKPTLFLVLCERNRQADARNTLSADQLELDTRPSLQLADDNLAAWELEHGEGGAT